MTIDADALKKLLDLVGGDPADLAEFIEDFQDISPGLVADMQAGQAAGDWETVRIAAHTLKSNAKDLGAPALSELSKSLEDMCKSGATEGRGALIAKIADAQATATEALANIDPAAL